MTDQADELDAAVTRLFQSADPVPQHLVRAASASLSWRDPDAALAELVLDSALAGEPAGVRAATTDTPRMLSFAVGDIMIDVELAVRDRWVALVGQVSRPGPATIEVRHTAGTWSGSTDGLGRFVVADLPAGPLRISWTPPGAQAVRTPMFLP